MTQAAHTPGPWFITEGDEWTDCIHTETPEQGIWTVASVNKRRDEFAANRRLIAAAPDLLAALQNFVDGCSVSVDAFALARAAIAKATGSAA